MSCCHSKSARLLKYGFCMKLLRKNATLNSWTLFFFKKKVPVVLYRYLFVKKKVFNYSELHFSEVISYKIHTLVPFIITSQSWKRLFIKLGSKFCWLTISPFLKISKNPLIHFTFLFIVFCTLNLKFQNSIWSLYWQISMVIYFCDSE